jgi:hypothetical protein
MVMMSMMMVIGSGVQLAKHNSGVRCRGLSGTTALTATSRVAMIATGTPV